MARNILSWNMQGVTSGNFGLSSYTHLFQKVMPAVFLKTGGPLLVYVCEAGNPNLNLGQFTPGQAGYSFDSKTEVVPFGPAASHYDFHGTYCPWYEVDPNKTPNIRCSVLMMEIVQKKANYAYSFEFAASGHQGFDNKRPIIFAYQMGSNNTRLTSIGGAHNVSNEYAAITAINNIVKNLVPGSLGGAIVGDMNVGAPILPETKWPTTLKMGAYQPMTCGLPTQGKQSQDKNPGRQLDWGFHNYKNVTVNCSAVSTLGTGMSGNIYSDHEMLLFTIT